MKKYQILFFILAVFLVLGIIVFFFPKDGIKITDNFYLYFPDYEKWFSIKEEKILDTLKLDTLELNIEQIVVDSFDLEKVKQSITTIEFPDSNVNLLKPFFDKLNNISEIGKIRIMHYGDSQIEGDRITAEIRNKLQTKYGGNAIGLVSPLTSYAQWSLLQDASDNWTKYLGYGYIDTLVKHNKYGPMINFCRFTPINNDSIWVCPEEKTSAYIHYQKSKMGYPNTTIFKKISVFYGNANEACEITIKSGEDILAKDSLIAGPDFYVYSYIADDYLSDVTISFEGYDSPDIYAVSLEDDYGVTVDNIGLRGSSGNVFANQDAVFLSQCFNYLSPDLIILQFGGNAIPNIKDKKQITGFCNFFKWHASFIKDINPNAVVIVIGPSDMSTKIKGEYETYPLLEDFIAEFKASCFSAGICYWDCYKAMGGKNSMPYWVSAEPALAAEDYVHFSPYGVNIISNLFYNALMLESVR